MNIMLQKNQAKPRSIRFAEIAFNAMPRHKHNHFNLIQQMNKKELIEFVDDRKHLINIKTNSKISESQRKELSMITYARNLLRLRS